MRALLVLSIAASTAIAAPRNDAFPRSVVIVVDRALTAKQIESVRLGVKGTVLTYDEDELEVVAYGKTARQVRRHRVVSTSEPTNLVAGLELAHQLLRGSKNAVRRVIVVTANAPTGVEAAIEKLGRDHIVVSAIGFEAQSVAPLAAIAKAGNGRHYVATSSADATAALQKELDRPAPGHETIAEVIVIDRSLQRPSIEFAKELARQRVEALSPNDVISVITFEDGGITEHVRAQRAANKMRLSHDISRVMSANRASNADAGLQKAFDVLKNINLDVKRVVFFGRHRVSIDVVKQMAAAGISVSIWFTDYREGDREALEAIVKAGNGQLLGIEPPKHSLKMR